MMDGSMEHLIGLYLAGAITPQTYVNGLRVLAETPLTPPASPQTKGFPQAKGSAAGTHPGSAPATHPGSAPATHPAPAPTPPPRRWRASRRRRAQQQAPTLAPHLPLTPAPWQPPTLAPCQPPTPAPRQPPTPAPRQPPPQGERRTAAEERPSCTDQEGAMERLIGLFLAGNITPETYVNGTEALTETSPTPAPIPHPSKWRASCRQRAQQAEETPSEQPTQHARAAPQVKDSPSSTQHGRAAPQAKDSPKPAAVGAGPLGHTCADGRWMYLKATPTVQTPGFSWRAPGRKFGSSSRRRLRLWTGSSFSWLSWCSFGRTTRMAAKSM